LATLVLSDFTKRDEVNIAARRYRKNCQSNYEEMEEESWNTAQKLAQYAQKWVAGGAYQTTAEFWFGKGSSTIMIEL